MTVRIPSFLDRSVWSLWVDDGLRRIAALSIGTASAQYPIGEAPVSAYVPSPVYSAPVTGRVSRYPSRNPIGRMRRDVGHGSEAMMRQARHVSGRRAGSRASEDKIVVGIRMAMMALVQVG
jgi:hypothetical protein